MFYNYSYIYIFCKAIFAFALVFKRKADYNKHMTTKNIYDIAIIGAGPAGLTAGIYAARAGLKCAILEKAAVGGLATTTASVENYPGIKQTDGFSLCYTMMEQCTALGADFVFDAVSEIVDGSPKLLKLTSGKDLLCKAVIITAGASPKKLNVDGEDGYIGRGISYCATCDGAFFKGKTVAVVGGGNTAVEDALYLEKLAGKVYLIHRRNELRAERILADKLKQSTVQPIWDSIVTELHGDNKLTQITLKNVKNGELTAISVDGVFVAIGQTPNSDIFADIKLDDKGYIVTDDAMRTSKDGVFAAGDIRSKSLRQIVTACADGAIAADTAAKSLM